MKLKTSFGSGKSKSVSAPLRAQAQSARLYLQPLEPRVLLDAAAAKTVQEAAPAPAPEPVDQASDHHAALVDALAAVQQAQAAPQAPAEPAHTEVYFIDRQVADVDRLAQSLPPGAEVHFIESNVDGVQFIAQTLQGRTDVEAIHILSHGVEGQLRLGTAFLDVQHMQGDYRAALSAIGQSMTADGDILIYGCDFAAGADGQQAVQVLAELTGADVAASNDDTGAARLDGDWMLEVHQGSIETASLQADDWDHLMAAPVVDFNSGANSVERVTNGNFGGGTQSTAGWVLGGSNASGATTGGTYRFEGTTSASLTQTTITGWDDGLAPSGAARVSFTLAWSNALGAGVLQSATLEVSVGGVVYMRLTTSAGTGTPATIQYLNGASGSRTTIAAGTFPTISLDLPANVASSGDLRFNYTSTGLRGDQISVGGVSVRQMVDITPGNNFTASYTENGPPVSIADVDMSIRDTDNTNMVSATITLTNAQAGDVLSVGTLPAGITSSIDTSVPGQIRVTLTGSSSLANYATAIRAITFSNSTDSPSTTPRVLTTTVNDGTLSSAPATTTINVTAINDAPILANTDLTVAQTEDAGPPSGAVGSLVSTLTGGVTDPDQGAVSGIAVTATSAANGTWWYSTDNGATWLAMGTVSGASARLLAADAQTRVYFQPTANFSGAVASSLTLRAWDRTNGLANGSLGTTATNGGTSAYSVATDTVTVNVAPVNDAPTLSTTPFSASSITEDLSQSTPVGDPNSPPARAGVALTTFVTTTADIDTGAAATGYAIVGADNTNGQWWFSLDSGATWTAMSNLSDANAVLLTRNAATRVFFQPNADWNGTTTLTLRAWDGTQGTAGQLFDITAGGGTGGTSAFSSTTAVGTHTVTAVADITADAINLANAALEDTIKVFNPLTAAGGGTADSFEGGAAAQITAIAGQAIAPGGTVAVPNGTVTLGADGQTLTFLGALNFTGTSTFSYTVTSGGVTETANITVTVTAVGDPPVIDLNGSAAGTDYTATIDQDKAPIGSGITVTDAENNNLSSMTITLANATAADLLSLAAAVPGITASYNAATGVLTLTGNTTLANYQTALAGVVFSTTSGSTAARTITVQATSTVAPTASNIAVATITPIDTDGDGVANAGDIDDDNDGLIDSVESQASLPPPTFETTMEGAADRAWTEDTNPGSLNSTVAGTGWTNWIGSADTWKGAFSLNGSGAWAGANNGVPGAAEGDVFMSIFDGEAVRLQIPASAGVQVGDVIRIDFQQIFGGVNGMTPLNMPANFLFTIDGVAFNAEMLFYNGNNPKEWSPGQITFTAKTTQPVIVLGVARPTGERGACRRAARQAWAVC